jgi:transcriptional regulator with XRE-family HTH domain
VASSPSYWSTENCQNRARQFGRLLVAWRHRSGWSQYEIPRWAEAAGFIGPAIGTVSQLERGRVTTPTMSLFASLGEINQRLVAQDFSGVTSRKLLDRLKGGVPILDADGNAWDFHAFCNAFHLPHLVNGPIWDAITNGGKPAPELTPAELERVNTTLRDGFLLLAAEVRPLSRALQLAGRCAPAGEREAYEDALGGIGYERDQLQQLWDGEAGEWSPLIWLTAVREERQAAP